LIATDDAGAIHKLVRTALLVALCVALGYLMAGIPNIELISAATFTCGVLVGPRRGALIGALAEAIYSGFNPYGIAPPPLYAAQLLGFAFIGAAGGMARPLLLRSRFGLQAALAGAAGLLVTLVYDVLTNIAVWVSVREGASLAAVVLGGLSFPFPLAHSGSNAVAFALVVPAVLRAVQRRAPR
jgi:hypothetical protein